MRRGALDGIRTRWHELWYITLPSMKSILLFSAVMQIQAMFSVGAVIVAAGRATPARTNSVDTIVSHLSDVGTVRYEMGYAAGHFRVLVRHDGGDKGGRGQDHGFPGQITNPQERRKHVGKTTGV